MATNRRGFLKVLSVAGGTASIGALLPSCAPPPEGPTVVGNAADFSEGLTIVDGSGVIVGRDAAGLFALSALCTHAACDMSGGFGSLEGGGLRCTCHGSTFDANGARTGGPASTDLTHWALTVGEDGSVTVDIGSEVDATARVAG
jgi:Rieske Fe-S protein